MRRFSEFRWSVATTLARWSKYRLYGFVKGVLWALLLAAACVGGNMYGKHSGATAAVDSYHSMCYNNGGLVIDEQGRAVVCGPLTQIPQQEIAPWKERGLTKT